MEKQPVVKTDQGSCLTALSIILLLPLFFSLWILATNVIIALMPVDRAALFKNDLQVYLSIPFGLVLHDICQYAASRLLGGQPRYIGRKYQPARGYLQRKYFRVPLLRCWSPGTPFSLMQYLVILLCPALLTFVGFPAIMLLWPNLDVFSILWVMGYSNAFLIPFDFYLTILLLLAGKTGMAVVDEADGTYLVKN